MQFQTNKKNHNSLKNTEVVGITAAPLASEVTAASTSQASSVVTSEAATSEADVIPKNIKRPKISLKMSGFAGLVFLRSPFCSISWHFHG